MSLGKRFIDLVRSHTTPLQGGLDDRQPEPPLSTEAHDEPAAHEACADEGGTLARRRGWYATLGVPMDSDLSTVRRRYRQELVRFHPDRFAQDPEKLNVATEITRRLTEAYAGIATTA